MNIKIKKMHRNAIMPTYGSAGAAAFDLYAAEAFEVTAHGSGVVSTGLAFEIPPWHVMRVYSRSGHGFKNSIRLANCVGVIDSDYRGVVMVKLRNDGPIRFDVEKGDRIAQAIIEPVERVTFQEVDLLSDTERGDGGFGSTGS
tara:strand:- start:1155 stop:1583 length:429 start_codon:yes stop_codon:yes gene_type:complete